MNKKKIINFGVKLGTRENDFKFGAINGVPKFELFPDGNSTISFSPGHAQKKGILETMSCVSQSATNVVEAIINRLIELKKISVENIQWLENNNYLDENNKLKISPRFTAKMSGTSENGNYQYRVHDSIRNDGLVPEIIWPFTDGMKWVEFYSTVPDDVKKIGLEFKKRFTIYVEQVNGELASYKESLKYSPTHIVIYAYNGMENGIYYKVDEGYNHAVAGINVKDTYKEIFDSYNDNDSDPWIKKLSLDYSIGFPYIFTVIDNSIKNMEVKDNYLYKLVEGPISKIALGLNGKLMEGEKIDVWVEFEARNNGDIKGKIISVNLTNWKSVPHVNMKGQSIEV
jgi:hypothetical protein